MLLARQASFLFITARFECVISVHQAEAHAYITRTTALHDIDLFIGTQETNVSSTAYLPAGGVHGVSQRSAPEGARHASEKSPDVTF